jgi:two-component system, cell cycle response regulator DivK
MRNDDEMERWRLGEVERELLEIAARARVATADHAAALMAEIKRIERVVRKAQPVARSANASNDKPRGRMKILYVEDNEDNIYMLKNRLSRAGFTVIVATDGTQGITMATSEQPDLILMDLTLPDINGEEATRRLKADPTTKDIPVIALTANAMASDRERAIAAGCDEFETKPVDMPRLLRKIDALKPHQRGREVINI